MSLASNRLASSRNASSRNASDRLASDHSTRAPFPILQRPACPRCGDMLFAAVATEFMAHGEIRNAWSCESCDHQFRTAFAFSPEH